jgi:class 3 adenylate cyclase
VLQYIGDEIEAVFGAPLRASDHADRALAAAHEMRRRLAELDARRARAGKPPLRNGIGIHTGIVLAGNIGSAERLTYALVGDAVNLASRIQGLNKELGTDILLSEATRSQLTAEETLEALSAVRVKGKSVEVSIYRAALSPRGHCSERQRRVATSWPVADRGGGRGKVESRIMDRVRYEVVLAKLGPRCVGLTWRLVHPPGGRSMMQGRRTAT